MKKINKIGLVLMIILLLSVSFIGMLENKVEAVILPITTADLYSKGEVVLFDYDNIGIGVEVIVYQKDGIEYPAYCINKGRTGITQEHSYSVDIHQLLTNNKVWRAIINGYPFKTPEELGCANMQEAYAATKYGVYDALYHYDLDKFTVHRDLDSNRRVVNAIKKIITAARNSSESKIGAMLKIKELTQEWKVDEKDPTYVSKIYTTEASTSYQNYQVQMNGEAISRFKLVDKNNVETTTFAKGQDFKVMIPISELEEKGEFTISASANLETMPILYGESPNPEWQNFAVTAGTYELAETNLVQKYYKNQTKIEIYKQDGEQKTPLANAIFELYDENHQVVHHGLTTDDKGSCRIDYLLPGTYYLKEIQAPNGYYGYEEEIKIELKLNEKVVINIDNFLETEEPEKEKPQEEEHVSFSEKKEVVSLPRTGF